MLAEFGRRRVTNVLVEGGAAVLGAFRDANLIDEVHVFVAPILAGGDKALSPIGGVGVDKIAAALRLADVRVKYLDGDFYVRGRR